MKNGGFDIEEIDRKKKKRVDRPPMVRSDINPISCFGGVVSTFSGC